MERKGTSRIVSCLKIHAHRILVSIAEYASKSANAASGVVVVVIFVVVVLVILVVFWLLS